MTPASPVIPGIDLPETVYAKNQPEYFPLPVWKQKDGTILIRWRLTWRERLMLLLTGNLYHWVRTFNASLQPMKLQVEWPGEFAGRAN